jgi:ribosomal protein L40E
MVGEFFVFVLIFVAIMFVSALVFGGWFLTLLVRGVAGFLGVRSGPPQLRPNDRRAGGSQTGPVVGQRLCQYELCKASNDGTARFCRRCGRELTRPAQVSVRRAAVW